MITLDLKRILMRIKECLELNSDADLADKIGVSVRKISNWKHRKTIPIREIISICKLEKLNLEYILVGNLEVQLKLSAYIDSTQVERNTAVIIKRKMLQSGVTTTSIAKQHGCSRSYISHIITGRGKNFLARVAVANAIGCDVEELWP